MIHVLKLAVGAVIFAVLFGMIWLFERVVNLVFGNLGNFLALLTLGLVIVGMYAVGKEVVDSIKSSKDPKNL